MRGCTHLVNTCTFDIDLIPMYFVMVKIRVQHCGMSGGLRTQRAPAFLSDTRSSGFPPGSPRHGAPRPERPATRATQRSCQPCPQASLVPPPPARAAPSARGAGDRLRSGAGPSRATRRRNSHPLRRRGRCPRVLAQAEEPRPAGPAVPKTGGPAGRAGPNLPTAGRRERRSAIQQSSVGGMVARVVRIVPNRPAAPRCCAKQLVHYSLLSFFTSFLPLHDFVKCLLCTFQAFAWLNSICLA